MKEDKESSIQFVHLAIAFFLVCATYAGCDYVGHRIKLEQQQSVSLPVLLDAVNKLSITNKP